MFKKITVILMLIVIFFVGGYYLVGYLTNTRKFGSFKIAVTLSDDIQTQIINSKGGNIILGSNKDDAVNLKFPNMSILGTTDITLSRIKSVGNLPIGSSFVNGVDINSTEDKLGNLATLTVPIPSKFTNQKLLGFVYDSSGDNYRLYPINIKVVTRSFK